MANRTRQDIMYDISTNIAVKKLILELLADLSAVQQAKLHTKYWNRYEQLETEYTSLTEELNRSET